MLPSTYRSHQDWGAQNLDADPLTAEQPGPASVPRSVDPVPTPHSVNPASTPRSNTPSSSKGKKYSSDTSYQTRVNTIAAAAGGANELMSSTMEYRLAQMEIKREKLGLEHKRADYAHKERLLQLELELVRARRDYAFLPPVSHGANNAQGVHGTGLPSWGMPPQVTGVIDPSLTSLQGEGGSDLPGPSQV